MIDITRMSDDQVRESLHSIAGTQLQRRVARERLWAVRGILDDQPDLKTWSVLDTGSGRPSCGEVHRQLQAAVEMSPIRVQNDLARWHVVLAWEHGCVPLSWASQLATHDFAEEIRKELRVPSAAEQSRARMMMTMEMAWARTTPGPDRFQRALRLQQLTNPRAVVDRSRLDEIWEALEEESENISSWWGDIGPRNPSTVPTLKAFLPKRRLS